MLAPVSFVPHPDFLHDTTGGRVVAEVVRVNAVEAQFGERVPQHGARRLRTVAPAPKRFSDPVAQLGAFVIEIASQTDRADEFATSPDCDGKYDLDIFLEAVLVRPNPLLGHAVLVGMR